MAGRYLAMDSPVDADLVVGVPESGNAAALGYSQQSGIPYGTAFVKNGYVGRTVHQAQAEQPGIQCPREAERVEGGRGRQAGHHDR